MTGYFAFPPSPDPKLHFDTHTRIPFTFNHWHNTPTRPPASATTSPPPSEHRDPDSDHLKDEAWAERRRRDAELHQARLLRDSAAAWQGELAWVRSGGIVRDRRHPALCRLGHHRAAHRRLPRQHPDGGRLLPPGSSSTVGRPRPASHAIPPHLVGMAVHGPGELNHGPAGAMACGRRVFFATGR